MRRATYELDGKVLTAFAFYQAAKAKYQWRGMRPSYLMSYRTSGGDKGCKRNPDAPPLPLCDRIDDAIMDMTGEELAFIKDAARKEGELLRTEARRA